MPCARATRCLVSVHARPRMRSVVPALASSIGSLCDLLMSSLGESRRSAAITSHGCPLAAALRTPGASDRVRADEESVSCVLTARCAYRGWVPGQTLETSSRCMGVGLPGETKNPPRIAPGGFAVTASHSIYFSDNSRNPAFVKRLHLCVQIGKPSLEIAQPCVCAVAVLRV